MLESYNVEQFAGIARENGNWIFKKKFWPKHFAKTRDGLFYPVIHQKIIQLEISWCRNKVNFEIYKEEQQNQRGNKCVGRVPHADPSYSVFIFLWNTTNILQVHNSSNFIHFRHTGGISCTSQHENTLIFHFPRRGVCIFTFQREMLKMKSQFPAGVASCCYHLHLE